MPARRRYARRRPTRRPRRPIRRRRYVRRARRVPRPLLLGNSHLARLTYESTYVGTPALDPGFTHVWRANSAFDPDFSAAGHQPRGFDQFMTFFDHYCVVGSKIVVQLINTATTTQGVEALLTLEDDSTPKAMIDQRERPGVVRKIMGPSDGGRNGCTLVKTFSKKRFFRNWGNPDALRGDSASNPAENAWYHLHLTRQGAVVPTNPVEIYVKMYLSVLFTERKLPPVS